MSDEYPPRPHPVMTSHSTPLPADRRALLTGLGGLAAGALLAGSRSKAHAGPLNPPNGPVAPTHKTLTEVEPRTPINATTTPGDANNLYIITRPGSYYLTGSITCEPGKNAIAITANDVTLDLNGFSILGNSVGSSGVIAIGDTARLSLRNGSVADCLGSGVSMRGPASRVECVSVANCGGNGISVGDDAQVRCCTSSENGISGFDAEKNAVFTDCAASFNGQAGFASSDNAAIARCGALSNGNPGIAAGNNSTLSNCRSEGNSTGIVTLRACSVVDCVARSNSAAGIAVFNSSLVARCIAEDNDGAHGIFADIGSAVIDCVATDNNGHGIEVTSDCLVRNNLSRRNGVVGAGSGILVTGSDTCVEDNHCTENDRGIHVTSTSCLIRRNTCANNSLQNWDIAVGNALATITLANINLATIRGDSYAGNLGSTDPNANFTF